LKTRKTKATSTPTVKDVSRLAGVSTATVSRVLAGFEEVSDETRKRVFEAVRTLNYQPNRNARNLRMNINSKIGVIISDIQNPFFSSVVRGIEKAAIKENYNILLGNSDEDTEREKKLIAMLVEERVAGIILTPTNSDPECYQALISSGIPYVIIDRRLPIHEVDMVLVDGFTGAVTAVEYLIGLKHTKIGFVGGLKHQPVMNEREQGYLAALRKHNLPVLQRYIQYGNNRLEGGYSAVRELLSLDQPPTALLIANNLMTLGGLQAIHETGLDIPGQISLVGFDDMDWASSLRPPLTVVAQPAFEMGETSASVLLERTHTPDMTHRTVMLNTKLVIRASCRDMRVI